MLVSSHAASGAESIASKSTDGCSRRLHPGCDAPSTGRVVQSNLRRTHKCLKFRRGDFEAVPAPRPLPVGTDAASTTQPGNGSHLGTPFFRPAYEIGGQLNAERDRSAASAFLVDGDHMHLERRRSIASTVSSLILDLADQTASLDISLPAFWHGGDSETLLAFAGTQFGSQRISKPTGILLHARKAVPSPLRPMGITSRPRSVALRFYISDRSDERKYRLHRG